MADDLHEILGLLTAAYGCELQGPEAFRAGDAISVDQYIALFEDPDYQWLVCEAPSGRGVEKDGVILGISIFSKNGVSRRNGVAEGLLGSIRLFAVLPRFHGVCIGLRLLKKTEALMYKAGCVRCMSCCSTARKSVSSWYKRRGYSYLGAIPYPFEQLEQYPKPKAVTVPKTTAPASASASETKQGEAPAPVPAPVKLMQFLKKIENTTAYKVPAVADGKGDGDGDGSGTEGGKVTTVLRLAHDNSNNGKGNGNGEHDDDTNARGVAEGEGEEEYEDSDDETDEDKRKRLGMPYVEGKMHLPPHWRHAVPPPEKTEMEELLGSVNAAAAAAAAAANDEGEDTGTDDADIPLD